NGSAHSRFRNPTNAPPCLRASGVENPCASNSCRFGPIREDSCFSRFGSPTCPSPPTLLILTHTQVRGQNACSGWRFQHPGRSHNFFRNRMGKTYTYTINIRCWKEHTCVGCGGIYAYELVRKIAGTGSTAAAAETNCRKKVQTAI